jgi:beta-N-acetylhexosaminidase
MRVFPSLADDLRPSLLAAAIIGLACLAGPVFAAGPAGAAVALASGPPQKIDFWAKLPDAELPERLVSEMTDEEVVAQVFMVGFTGSAPSREIMDWLKGRNLGGVKIFGWNTEDTTVLARSIGTMQKTVQKSSNLRIPLFIATDQEGGWIRHVKGDTTATPGNMAIGASGLPDDAYKSGYYIARELKALGINMNFGPVVDVYTDHRSTVIGPRSFAEAPEKVAMLGAAFFKGQDSVGVICTAKHFPGHGDTSLDSHGTLPMIYADMDTLWKRELVPYRTLAAEGLPAVMSGHLGFPRIAGTEAASLSPFFLKDVLRKRIGFTGIIITDDLYMVGAADGGDQLSDVCVKALRAGNDMIMLSKTPLVDDAIWNRVYGTYRSDPGFRDSVKASVVRILQAKLKYLKRKDAVPLTPDLKALPAALPDREGAPFFLNQACRSATAIYSARLPLKPAKAARVLLAGQFTDFFKAAREAYPGADEFRFSYLPADSAVPAEKAELLRRAAGADLIILCLANPASLELLQALGSYRDKVAVLSVLTPVYLAAVPWVKAAVAVYSYAPDSFRAGFAVLRGDITAGGTLPVSLRY